MVVPLPLRIVVVAIGVLLFCASWFVKNSTDAAEMPTTRAGHAALLQRDALTMSMRAIGAFLIAVGLLLWVFAHKGSGLY